jgi:hypothetical protein
MIDKDGHLVLFDTGTAIWSESSEPYNDSPNVVSIIDVPKDVKPLYILAAMCELHMNGAKMQYLDNLSRNFGLNEDCIIASGRDMGIEIDLLGNEYIAIGMEQMGWGSSPLSAFINLMQKESP